MIYKGGCSIEFCLVVHSFENAKTQLRNLTVWETFFVWQKLRACNANSVTNNRCSIYSLLQTVCTSVLTGRNICSLVYIGDAALFMNRKLWDRTNSLAVSHYYCPRIGRFSLYSQVDLLMIQVSLVSPLSDNCVKESSLEKPSVRLPIDATH